MEEDGFILVPKVESGSKMLPETDSHDFLPEIDSFVDSLEDALWPLNKFIHENPELAFEEYKTHDALTKFMRKQKNWKVTPSAYGLQTAWTALYDSGKPGPVVSFNAEMDALPKMGHACGHNLIAIASVTAALTTAKILKDHNLPGKILLLGTPGEEGIGGGKIQLLKAGAYKDVDITLISHPGIYNNSPLVRTTAFSRISASYFGQPAHAANTPWLGINALDAVVIAYTSLSALRQQTMPTDVLGITITNGGAASNIIHAYASAACVIRATSTSRLRTLQEKVSACFRAGAEASGARLELAITDGYADHVPNRVLAASYTRYWNSLSDVPEPKIPPPDQFTWVKASTDQGNLSYAMPSVNASFAIPPGPRAGPPHTPDFEGASGTRDAFSRALRVGKALAGTAVDVFSTPGLLERVREQWRSDMESAEGQVGDVGMSEY